jgi:hypothetical protein
MKSARKPMIHETTDTQIKESVTSECSDLGRAQYCTTAYVSKNQVFHFVKLGAYELKIDLFFKKNGQTIYSRAWNGVDHENSPHFPSKVKYCHNCNQKGEYDLSKYGWSQFSISLTVISTCGSGPATVTFNTTQIQSKEITISDRLDDLQFIIPVPINSDYIRVTICNSGVLRYYS